MNPSLVGGLNVHNGVGGFDVHNGVHVRVRPVCLLGGCFVALLRHASMRLCGPRIAESHLPEFVQFPNFVTGREIQN